VKLCEQSRKAPREVDFCQISMYFTKYTRRRIMGPPIVSMQFLGRNHRTYESNCLVVSIIRSCGTEVQPKRIVTLGGANRGYFTAVLYVLVQSFTSCTCTSVRQMREIAKTLLYAIHSEDNPVRSSPDAYCR